MIGGEFRSRRLKTPPGWKLRPTPDRLRETLFDILAPRIEGAVFLDAYAGSGAVGIEALSRGAVQAIFLEKSRHAVSVLTENLKALGLESRAVVVHGGVTGNVARFRPGIAFLDPPYEPRHEYTLALEALALSAPPLVIVQHSTRLALRETFGALRRTRFLKQGDNALSFYETVEPAPG